MYNKRQIIYQVFVKVLKKKKNASRLLKAVERMKWHHISLWQMTENFSPASLLFLTSLQLLFSIPCSEKHSQKKNIFSANYLKFSTVNFTVQNIFFI
jgi:hypothetical protein